MRNIFLFTLILFTQYTYAVDMNALVNARNEEHELVPTEVVLTDLLDEEKLEGTFFKIVSKSTRKFVQNRSKTGLVWARSGGPWEVPFELRKWSQKMRTS